MIKNTSMQEIELKTSQRIKVLMIEGIERFENLEDVVRCSEFSIRSSIDLCN